MTKGNRVSTTIKIENVLYDTLKVHGVRHKFTLQSFVEKCINFYINDDKFKELVNNYNPPLISQTVRTGSV